MLALDVKVLTEKLQHQSLEEAQHPTLPGKGVRSEDGHKFTDPAHAKLAVTGKKIWTTLPANSKTGKKFQQNTDVPGSGNNPKGEGVLCPHKKLQRHCTTCDNIHQSTSSIRPKKRHCRSMSVPPDSDTNIPPAKSSWQPGNSSLWKPVPMTTVSNKRNCHLVNYSRELNPANISRAYTRTPTDPCISDFASLAPSLQRHIETGHITPEDFLTPPESPISRPSSASTGIYSDGAISPLGAPWLIDFSSTLTYNKHDAFRNRSLSLEDKISCSSSSCGGSVASFPGSVSSIPSSPHHRNKIPRCRSQPSFHHDRKGGRRRRRDYSRPTLNFHKMTETAYGQRAKCGSEKHSGYNFHDALSVTSLMPIASSPLDSDVPIHRLAAQRTSPIHELETSQRDEVDVNDADSGYAPGPVKLIGEDEEEDMDIFTLHEDLDIEQIENH